VAAEAPNPPSLIRDSLSGVGLRQPGLADDGSEPFLERSSQWLHDDLEQNPQFLAMHERALPLSGGYSFANVVHTQRVSVLASMNRHTILELVSQHLEAIGMWRTAEILATESGHVFQRSRQSWDRTDLHLLCSIAVGHRENAWDLPRDADSRYIHETLDEDFWASPYREDRPTICGELYNAELNIIYDSSGSRALSNIRARSLRRFVVHFATVKPSSRDDCPMFLLSLPAITSASHLLEHFATLYDIEIDSKRLGMNWKEFGAECSRSIVLFIKHWTEFPMGKRTLKLVTRFLKRMQKDVRAQKMWRIITDILKSIGGAGAPAARQATRNARECPQPVTPDPLILFRPRLSLLDPDPIEVGRQITLIYYDKYSSIHALEFVIALANRRPTIRTPTIADFFGFGDSLTLLFAEAFLRAEDKGTAFKRIVEIVRCLAPGKDLNNVGATARILRFLRRPDVTHIGGATAELIRELDDDWSKCGEADRDKKQYKDFIKAQFETSRPTIPNLHAEVKAGDKRSGQEPDYINGLINWEKLRPHAMRCVILRRFQLVDYKFCAVSQIQNVILKGPVMSEAEIVDRLEELTRISAKE
jgi:hypothetical protein